MNRKIMTQPSLFLSRRYARCLVCASTQAGLTAALGSLFDDEKGYLPFFVLLSCGAGVSSFSTAS